MRTEKEKEDILNIFTNTKVRNKMEEILGTIERLSLIKPTIGFHPKFYVPGWIGVIQNIIAGDKMDKWAKKTFCDGKGYYEYADWIINEANDIAKLQTGSRMGDESSQQIQNETIIKVFHVWANLWLECAPEVATNFNIKVDDNTLTSVAGAMFSAFEEFFAPLGFNPTSKSKDNESWADFKKGIKEDAKDTLYQFAGYFLNIILLCIVFGIISGIASLFD